MRPIEKLSKISRDSCATDRPVAEIRAQMRNVRSEMGPCRKPPVLWLSGMFFPLPGALERLVVIWPAFHLNQVSLGLAGVTEYSYLPPQWSVAALVGVTVLFGGLAIRRLARKGSCPHGSEPRAADRARQYAETAIPPRRHGPRGRYAPCPSLAAWRRQPAIARVVPIKGCYIRLCASTTRRFARRRPSTATGRACRNSLSARFGIS